MSIKKIASTLLLSILIVMATGCDIKSDDIECSTSAENNRMLKILFFDQLKSEINASDTLDLYFTDINADGNVDVIMRPVEKVTSTAMGIFQQMYFFIYNGEEFVKVLDIDNFSEEYEFCIRSYESDGTLIVINGAYSFGQGTDSSFPEKMISNDIIQIKFSSDTIPSTKAKKIMYMQSDFENDNCIRAYVSKAFANEFDVAVNEIPEWSKKNYYAISEDEYKNISEEYFNTLVSEIPIEYGSFTVENRNEYTPEQLVELLIIQ